MADGNNPALPRRVTRTELDRATAGIPETLRKLARVDPVWFCRYVMRDEKTGARVQLQPFHEEMVLELTGFQRPANQERRVVVTGAVSIGKTQIAIACAVWLIVSTVANRLGDKRVGRAQ